MAAKIITWGVHGMGGPLYRGIPSRDVAITMAVDFERYRSGFANDQHRVEVTVELDAYHDCGSTYIAVTGEGSRGLGVHQEVRCGKCRLVPRSNFSGVY